MSFAKKTIRYYAAPPQAGDILNCAFPYDDVKGVGKKNRPCIVLSVSLAKTISGNEYIRLKVGYGTSQHTDREYPGEFVIPGNTKSAGLTCDTKFSLTCTAELPYNSEWFPPCGEVKDVRQPARRGRLNLMDARMKDKIGEAMQALNTFSKNKPALASRTVKLTEESLGFKAIA